MVFRSNDSSELTARTEDARLPVFAYVDAEKAALYRAIMRVFIHAKERFSLRLRPEEVWRELRGNGVHAEQYETHVALKQLRDWENLRADPDTAEVETVEEFYRERLLYQLTRRGEAAERALLLFEELLKEPGELQTSALHDIRAHLAELETLTHEDALDGGKIHRSLSALSARFDKLTSKAQIFLGGLQRSADLHRCLGAEGRPLICTSGQTRNAARELLRAFRAAGVRVRYHADFDWPGITIARGLYGREGAEPWRMQTSDCLDGPEGPPLQGGPVETPWDATLAPAMVARGRAVHEEAVLAELLRDLAHS